MKPFHTENFYKKFWDEFINDRYDRNYMNLEEDLEKVMEVYEKTLADYPQVIETFRTKHASDIAEKAKSELLETMAMIKRLDAGETSLGYTSVFQECQEMKKLKDRFEFNCYQLSVFRKKYNI